MNLLYIAVGPTLVILFYIYMRDKYDKEPSRYLFMLFFLGCISVIPAAVLEVAFTATGIDGSGSLPEKLVYAFFGVALIEEGLKYIILRLTARKSNRYFNQKYDSVVYAVFISLGFATVENVLYVIQSGFAAGIMRAVTAVPAHAVFAVAMGYWLGQARFLPSGMKRSRNLWLSIFVPVVLVYIFYINVI
jgi:RsiW-degrading membrane proteinase PrsW (M82 family)